MPPKDWRAGCGCVSILCVRCSLYQPRSAEDQMAGVGSGGHETIRAPKVYRHGNHKYSLQARSVGCLNTDAVSLKSDAYCCLIQPHSSLTNICWWMFTLNSSVLVLQLFLLIEPAGGHSLVIVVKWPNSSTILILCELEDQNLNKKGCAARASTPFGLFECLHSISGSSGSEPTCRHCDRIKQGIKSFRD